MTSMAALFLRAVKNMPSKASGAMIPKLSQPSQRNTGDIPPKK